MPQPGSSNPPEATLQWHSQARSWEMSPEADVKGSDPWWAPGAQSAASPSSPKLPTGLGNTSMLPFSRWTREALQPKPSYLPPLQLVNSFIPTRCQSRQSMPCADQLISSTGCQLKQRPFLFCSLLWKADYEGVIEQGCGQFLY